MWFVPKHTRAKLDHTWRYGIFLGRALHTDANFIGLLDGSVVTARAMVRVVPRNRWNVDRINRLTAIPGNHKATFDSIEAEAEPHNFAPAEVADDSEEHAHISKRRLKITLRDLGRYRFGKNCPK